MTALDKLLKEAERCASAWEPEARILGNLKASQILAIIAIVKEQRQQLRDAHGSFEAISGKLTDRGSQRFILAEIDILQKSEAKCETIAKGEI